jgi:hypothetical protein
MLWKEKQELHSLSALSYGRPYRRVFLRLRRPWSTVATRLDAAAAASPVVDEVIRSVTGFWLGGRIQIYLVV